MISLVAWFVFGAVVGGVAKWFYPGKAPSGWIPTIAIGVIGSLAGGLPFQGHPAGFLGSIIGAVICLFAYGAWENADV